MAHYQVSIREVNLIIVLHQSSLALFVMKQSLMYSRQLCLDYIYMIASYRSTLHYSIYSTTISYLWLLFVSVFVHSLFLSKFVINYLSSYNLNLVAGNSINYPSIFATISRIYFWKSLQSILSSVLTSLELVTLRRRTHCAISLISSKRNYLLLPY